MFCQQVLCFQVYGICQQCFAWTEPRDWNGNSARPGDTNWEDMKWKNNIQKHHQYTLTKRIHCNAIICTCVTHTIHVWSIITECNYTIHGWYLSYTMYIWCYFFGHSESGVILLSRNDGCNARKPRLWRYNSGCFKRWKGIFIEIKLQQLLRKSIVFLPVQDGRDQWWLSLALFWNPLIGVDMMEMCMEI